MPTANDIDPKSTRRQLAPVLHRCATQGTQAFSLLMRPARVGIGPRQAWLGSPQNLIIATAAFGLLFIFGMIFVDTAVTDAALRLPRWIVLLFQLITDFGEWSVFIWPLGIVFLLLACLPTSSLTRFSQRVVAATMVRVGFLFMAVAVPSLIVAATKRMIGRARPMVTGELDPFAFSPFHGHAAYTSLPSGHATTAFAVLVALGVLWPRARTVLLIYALLISASRVIIGAHYPTDVLAGAAIGATGALMVRRWFALRRLGFSIGADKRIHLYPGPSLKRIKQTARDLLAD